MLANSKENSLLWRDTHFLSENVRPKKQISPDRRLREIGGEFYRIYDLGFARFRSEFVEIPVCIDESGVKRCTIAEMRIKTWRKRSTIGRDRERRRFAGFTEMRSWVYKAIAVSLYTPSSHYRAGHARNRYLNHKEGDTKGRASDQVKSNNKEAHRSCG
ncbi:hypothetical protein FNV43_RR11699 [Rhamnella rubrinervis]|uniref:Uncharacterized protein n=1 Tax=Rhamnella rubrinervis TaxID=2594499 RepID=A0A8K0H6T6_9ROSA|nr:hypothetical protein FNV43_RR11699 [Rhamnella rubrinervis]